ncbi:MAG: hypothetical protein H2041_13430 [Phenylobacterium sp.]|uniref:hypothetical protein n=1 Tax=Phenylobacterium sp. TaxID=1871053 RepID=UPI0018201819|nr:hypothetical protein [Phenylobacterium sp.]MBA4794661.1 hypothetical protein [Phenylobacterium sp.]
MARAYKTLRLSLSEDDHRRFCAAAEAAGGGAVLVRRMLAKLEAAPASIAPAPPSRKPKTVHVAVRLDRDDAALLAREAEQMGLLLGPWVIALVRARLHRRPTFGTPEDVALAGVQMELRKIAVALRHMAHDPARRDAPLEQAELERFASDIRRELAKLRHALEGNLASWECAP